jgi:chromosome segregation protein
MLIKHSREKINELNNEKTELKGTLSDLEKQHGNIKPIYR